LGTDRATTLHSHSPDALAKGRTSFLASYGPPILSSIGPFLESLGGLKTVLLLLFVVVGGGGSGGLVVGSLGTKVVAAAVSILGEWGV
jgi:hypothetical protein